MKRVILDTNYFRSLRASDLVPLRQQGFSISVSATAIYEAWAAAKREGKPGILLGPARALSAVVDPTYPIAPSGRDLMWRFSLGRRKRDRARVTQRFSAWSLFTWQVATSGRANESLLLETGTSVDAYVSGRGQEWLKYARPWDGSEKQLLKDAEPQKARRFLERHLREGLNHSSSAYRIGMARRRLDAFYRTVSLYLRSTALGATTATDNDLEDLRCLMHLAEPAVLLTHDAKLIELVDKSGSYQAPWVCRLSDMVTPPNGRPWSSNARRASSQFRRRACVRPCSICHPH